MGKKQFLLLLTCILVAFSFCTGCSKTEENSVIPKKTNLFEIYHKRLAEDRERSRKAAGENPIDESKREKQMAVADACEAKYDSCLEKCKTGSCEDKCHDALSVCEKDLPEDLKTIKDK